MRAMFQPDGSPLSLPVQMYRHKQPPYLCVTDHSRPHCNACFPVRSQFLTYNISFQGNNGQENWPLQYFITNPWYGQLWLLMVFQCYGEWLCWTSNWRWYLKDRQPSSSPTGVELSLHLCNDFGIFYCF